MDKVIQECQISDTISNIHEHFMVLKIWKNLARYHLAQRSLKPVWKVFTCLKNPAKLKGRGVRS